ATRVRVTRNTVVSVLAQVAANGVAWRAACLAADARAARLAGAELALTYKATDKARMIDFRGYAYSRTQSEVSGQLMTRYDETRPQIWRVPVRDEIVPDVQVRAPQAGYVVPPEHAAMVGAKLKLHGISFRTLAGGKESFAVETYRAKKATFGSGSVESHQRLALEGEWTAEPRSLTKGSLYVPVGQPKARLVVALFEPKGPDSMLAWGGFNSAFERKEYMEDYVAEDVARAMMATDPALAARFKARIDADPAFAKSAEARLEFFAQLHESWDERYKLYPVVRTAVAP
ncbi:MAG: peptidase M14, partial [Telluria sp.]